MLGASRAVLVVLGSCLIAAGCSSTGHGAADASASADAADGANDCPVCGGSTGGCDCPCSPPPTGESCVAEACDYGNGTGTVADCVNGYFQCSGPLCPPPRCPSDALVDSYCCQGTGTTRVLCDTVGNLTCPAGYSLCTGPAGKCPCDDSGLTDSPAD